MNRNYKVIWNRSLNCFMAVAEYAKSRGKSSNAVVSSSASVVSNDTATGGKRLLRLSALSVGLVTAGFTISPQVFAAASIGGTGSGTVISSTNCVTPANTGTNTTSQTGAVTSYSNNVAIGCEAETKAPNSLIADRNNPYNTDYSTVDATGRIKFSATDNTALTSSGSTVIGTGALSDKALSVAVGAYAHATEVAGVAIGTGALSKGNTALAIGRQSAATADYAQAIGNVAAATGKGTLAIGHSATATGYRAIAIGSPDIENAGSTGTGQSGTNYQTAGQTKATAKDSIAFGGGAQATADNALSLGAFSEATATKSVAIGTNAKATAANAVVIGDGATTAVTGGVAIGQNAQVTGANSAALGQNSLATAQTGNAFLTGTAATTQGTVSVGSTTIKRRITNVADGAASTDAVNVAQLTAQNTLTNKQGTDTAAALGGTSTYNPATGAVSAPAYSVGGATVNNVGAAITNIDGRTTTNATNIAGNATNIAGLQNQTFRLRANTDTSTAVASGDTVTFLNGDNVEITRTGNNIKIGTSATPTFTTVTSTGAVNAGSLNTTGALTVTGASNLNGGADLNNTKITNVANGSVTANSKDAINGSQLFTNAESVKNIIGGTAVYAGGIVTATNIGGTGATTIDGAITNVKDAATKAKTTVTEGKNVTVTTSTNANGSTDYNVKTKDDLALTSITAGNSVLNNAGLTIIGGPSVTATGINAGSKIITNVANGTVNTDAANFGQVKAAKSQVAAGTNVTSVVATSGANGESIYTVNADKSTVSGGSAAVTVTAGTKNANNVTDYAVDLSAATKTSLGKADTAIQTVSSNDTNLTAVKTGNNVVFDFADAPTFAGQVKANGFDANSNKIVNVANGTVATDAATFGQLTTTNTKTDALGASTAANLGGGATYNATTGAVSAPAYSLNNGTVTATTVGGALTNLDGRTTTNTTNIAINATNVAKGFNISAAGGTPDNVQLGETVNFTSTDKNLVVTNNGANGINYDLADNIVVDKVTAGNSTLNNAGVTITDGPNNTVTLSGSGLNNGGNRITGLANGIATDDAATFGQLSTTNAAVTDAGNIAAGNLAALGGGATYDAATDTYTAPTYTLNNGTTSFNTVGGALSNLDGRTTTNANNITGLQNQTFRLRANTDTSTPVASGDTVTFLDGDNVKITRAGNNVTIGTSLNPTFTTVTSTGAVTAGSLNTGGALTVTGASNLNGGANLNNNKITGVAAGTAATDAVNVGQLTTAGTAVNNKINALGTSTAANLGGDAKYNAATGAVSAPTYTLDNGANTGTTADFDNVGSALDNLNTRTTTNTGDIANVQAQANKGFNISAASGTKNNVQLGETVDFTNTDSNLVVTASANGINYNLAKNLDLDTTGSLKTGNTVTNNTGVRIDDGTGNINAVTATGTNVTNGTSTSNYGANGLVITDTFGNSSNYNAGSNTVSNGSNINVNTATVSYISDSTGNINISTANNNVISKGTNRTTASATGTNVTDGTNTSNYGANGLTATDGTNTTTLNKTGLSFTDANGATGPSITAAGINAGNQVLTNVGAGSITATSKDAINGSQLFGSAESVKNVIGGNAVNTNGVVTSTDIGGTGANTIDGAITNVKDAATKAKTTVTEGKNVTVTTSTNADGSTDYNVRTKDDLALTSVTTGNSVLNNTGLTITGGPSVTTAGINAANTKVTGVAAGTAATDAVNVGQLTTAGTAVNNKINALGTSTAANLGGDAKYNAATGAVSAPTYTLDNGANTGTTADFDNVGSALDNLNTRTTTNTGDIADLATGKTGLVRQDNGTGIITVGAATGGNSVNFANSTGDARQLTGVASAGDYKVAGNANNAVNAGDLNTAVNSVTDLGLSFAGDSGKNVQRKLGETLNVTGGANTVTLTDNNIGVVTNDTNGLIVKLNKDIDLGVDGSLKTGNTVTNNAGVTITNGANITAVTSAGTNVTDGTSNSNYSANGFTATDGNGNTGSYNAASTVLTDDSGNINASAAFGNVIRDASGNTNVSGAIGNAVFDNQGNFNLSGARGSVVFDNAGNRTTTSATGTNVTDGTNTSNYGANGLTATDGTNTTNLNTTGLSFTDVNGAATGPSITAAGINAGNSTISNVADGVAASDVATFGQLTASNAKTDALGTSTAANLGGDAKYNATTGAVSAPVYTLDNGANTGTTADFNNVGSALDNLNTRTTTNTGNIAKGINIGNGNTSNKFALGDTINVTGDNNLTSTTTATGVQVALNKDIDLGTTGSIRTGNTSVNNAGITILNGTVDTVTLGRNGLNNGGNRITNLAAGVVADDAATFGQVTDVNNKVNTLGTSTAANLGGDAKYNAATGAVSAPTYTLDNGANTGTTADFDNVGSALDNLNTRTTTNTGDIADLATGKTGLVRQDNGTGIITVGAATGGNSVNFANSTGDARQLTGVASAGDYKVAGNANNAVNAGDLNTAVNSVTDLGLSFAGDSGKNVQRKLGETLNVTGGANTATLTDNNIGVVTNDTNGLIVKLNKDIDLGADGSLKTGNTVTNNAGVRIDNGTGNITAVTSAGTNVTDGTNTSNYGAEGLTIVGGPSITTAGINAGNSTISNVADGVAASDVATFGQLTAANGAATAKTDELGTSTAANLGGGAAYTAATGTVSAPAYTLDDGTNTGTNVTANNVGGALDNLNTRTTTNTGNIANVQAQANKGFNISAAGGTANNVQLGKTVDFTNTDGNLVATASANGINYNLAENIDLGTTGSFTAGNSVLNNAGLTIAGGPSVTTAGINAGNQVITGVASGSVTANSTNATNGGQLFNTAESVKNVIGGNAVNTGGVVTASNIGGTGANTIDGAITNVRDAATKAKTTVTEGKNVTVTSSTNADGSTDYNVRTNDDLALTSVTTGNSILNNAGLTIAGGPSITTAGINAAGTKITGVANGTAAGDAVNFGQLQASNGAATAKTDALGTSTAANLGGGAAYTASTGTISAPAYTLDDGSNTGTNVTANNVGGALDNLNTRTTTNTGNIANVQAQANKGFNISAAGGTANNVQLGKTVDFTNTDGNLVATASANGINYNLAENIDLGTTGSLKTGNTVTNNAGVRIDDGTGNITAMTAAGTNVTDGTNTSNYGANGLTIAGGPSVTTAGINAGNQVITGVASGSVTANSTNATNGGQLFNTAESVKNVIGGNAVNTGGVVTASNIGGTGANTIDGAITNVRDAATKAKTTVTEGKNVTVTSSTNADGSTDYNVRTNDDLALTSVTTGNTVTNNAGVRIDDGTGNITAMTAAGTNVTDGTNTSNYGANGFTIVGGPSVTTAGINAGNKTITNLADGVAATDAATKGQVDAVSSGLTDLTAGAVQYERNNGNINYNNVTFAGTQAVIDQDEDGNDFVVSGGTRLSNVANGISAADAVNKGQLDGLIAQNVTNVEVNDKNGNPITVNITDQVVNRNINNDNMDSLFLTYNVEGQNVTDRLTIGETVQRMNTEGVKFAHTKAVSNESDIGVTNDSSAGGDNSTAIGVNAIIREGANSTVALGHDTEASANATNSVVIGKGSQVNGQSSIAIGDGAQAMGNQSISIGTGNIVNGNNSGAFGDPSIINGDNSYSVGNNNTITTDNTFVLGNNVTSTVAGSVVLGNSSAARTGAGVVGYLAAGNAAITATTSTTGAVAVGDAANGIYRQVTGVAAGTADSDAVNVSQLKAVSDTLQNNNTALSNAAVQYDKNADGTVNKGSITLGGGAAGTTITNVAAGNISAGSKDAVNGSQLHNLGSGVAGIVGGDATFDAAGNLTASNIGGTGKGNISDAIAAVNQGNAQANENIKANTDRLDAGLSFGADSGTTINKAVGDTTALKFEGGKNITTTTTSSGIKFDLNGNIDVDNITASTVTTGNTTVNNSGVTIKDGPSMTTEGINAGGKTITGVADGIKVNDAVNLGQLSALDNKLSNSVNELGYKINEVEDDANAGISAAMAMSSLPQAYIPGKSMVGGGIATYNGQSAVAIGVSKVSDNGRWVIKVNGTADTQGNAGGAVGAGFHF